MDLPAFAAKRHLSAIIFNILIIAGVGPLALGVTYRLGRQRCYAAMLVYGLGGVAAPFIGIKAIDLAVTALGLA